MSNARGRLVRPVPDAPRTAVALIRVSKVGGREDLLSPTLQRTAISDYAARNGIEVAEWVEALDETASRDRSKWWRKLDDAVATIEAGQRDVVLVWKVSRAARHRLKWAVAIDRIERAGGALESATEGYDPRTSGGRLQRGMLAEFAAFESEVKGEQWKETHADRIRRGLPANGKPRWGYSYTRGGGFTPDEKLGPVLAGLYRRYTAGESANSLAMWLNEQGHRTTLGNRFDFTSMIRMLDRGFGAGLLYLESERRWVPGVHEPVITEAEWRAYRARRATARVTPSQAKRGKYPLSGLVRCARCGGPMYPGDYGWARQSKYRCESRYKKGPGACVGGYVMVAVVEDAVLRWLRELVDSVDAAAAATEASVVQRITADQDAKRLARAITKLDKALAQLVVDKAKGEIPERAYRDARDQVLAEQQLLGDRLRQAELRSSHTMPDLAEYRGLLVEWKTMPVPRKRDALARAIARVEVTTGRPRGTVEVVPVWVAGGR